MAHPSYGILSPQEFQAAVAAPAGGALRIIREKDPLWGKTTGSSAKLRHFNVTIDAKATITQRRSNTFTVLASDEGDAENQALAMADKHDFDFDDSPDDIDLEVDKVALTD